MLSTQLLTLQEVAARELILTITDKAAMSWRRGSSVRELARELEIARVSCYTD